MKKRKCISDKGKNITANKHAARPFTACLLALALCFGALFSIACAGTDEPTVAEAYRAAMEDAVFAASDELLPLVRITKDSDMVTRNETGDKVLLLSWNSYPESYPDGSSFLCSYGEIWTFTDREMLSWYQKNSAGVADWELRIEQLLGLPAEAEYTHITAFWVEPAELIRPAYETDITKDLTPAVLDGSALGDYEVWFDGNTLSSCFDAAHPWTRRLGYTYDRKPGGSDDGLSEFIILADSTVEVAFTVTTAEFLDMLAAGRVRKN